MGAKTGALIVSVHLGSDLLASLPPRFGRNKWPTRPRASWLPTRLESDDNSNDTLISMRIVERQTRDFGADSHRSSQREGRGGLASSEESTTCLAGWLARARGRSARLRPER